MMTDRELIELAAKAAGIEEYERGLYAKNGWWNPLKSDADAFRLAVKLCISVQPESTHVVSITKGNGHVVMLPAKEDVYAATRRAITIAAAEIGKAM